MQEPRKPRTFTPEGEMVRDGEDERLRAFGALAHLLDEAFRLPGTKWRFGIEAVLGLVPGVGDVLGSAAGWYGIWLAREMGAPASVQLRMATNLGIDAFFGLVPFLGDLFDFGFKAHTRNHALLSRWLAKPHATRRSSVLVLVVAGFALLGLTAGAIWIGVQFLQWVAAHLF